MKATLLAVAQVFLAAVCYAAKPNVVLVLADDLGWSDTGILGARLHETPNIDALARDGMVLSNYHASQNCAPSRASLMTGQYSPRTGIYTVGKIGRFDTSECPLQPAPNNTELPSGLETVAQAMKGLGYATGMFGKWHLGDDGEYHPSRRGFDEAVITSIDRHFKFATKPETSHPPSQYLADFVTDRAVDFIRRHKDGPFFLYLPHLCVHRPLQAPEELVREYCKKHPDITRKDAVYAVMVDSLDKSVGRIRQTLRDLGIEKNTVLIFCSDNGGVGGYRREGLDTEDVTDNAPLRSGKGSLYEGGVRVPFAVCWPGTITAGSRSDVPAIHVDLFPTLCELGGGDPSARPGLDGQSLVPWLLDRQGKPAPKPLFQHFPGYLGLEGKRGQWRTTPVSTVQSGPWKLMEFLEDGRLELYNLETDPGETKNLAASMKEKAGELRALLDDWRKRCKAPMPERKTAALSSGTQGSPSGGKGAGALPSDEE